MDFSRKTLARSIPVLATRCRARKRLTFDVEESESSTDTDSNCTKETSIQENSIGDMFSSSLKSIQILDADSNEHPKIIQGPHEDRSERPVSIRGPNEARIEHPNAIQSSINNKKNTRPKTTLAQIKDGVEHHEKIDQPENTTCNDLLETALSKSQIQFDNSLLLADLEENINPLGPLSPRAQQIEDIIANLDMPEENVSLTDLSTAPKLTNEIFTSSDTFINITEKLIDKPLPKPDTSAASTSKAISKNTETNSINKRSKKVFLDFLSEDEEDFQWSSSSWSVYESESDMETDGIKKKRKKRDTQNDDGKVGEVNRKERPPNKKKERKKLKEQGKEYITKTGKTVYEKRMLNNPCTEAKCKFNCWKITDERRNRIFSHFWNLDTTRRKDWLVAMTRREPIKRKRVKNSSLRNNTFSYFINSGEGREQVCQKFLLATLNITQTFVFYTIANSEFGSSKSDFRGKTVPANKTKDEHLNAARNYINNLPAMPSHYVRKDSMRLYLPNEFKSLSHLYYIYKESLISQGRDPIGEKVFINLFKSEFNIGIHHPKKDKCLRCISFKDKDDAEILEQKTEHEKDIKNSCERFKTQRKVTTNNSHILCVSFDLQKVLNTPYGESMLLYYSRKYSVYNLTFYENGTRDGYCYMWGESDAKRASNEICTILNKYIHKVDSRGTVTTLLFYCDSCPGQNKNKIVLAALHSILQQCVNITKIQSNFLLPGHTYMPADSIHSVIERSITKGSIVWAPSQWETIFAMARKYPRPYNVDVLTHKDFSDWFSFGDKYFKGNLIGKINKVRIATFIKTFPNTIFLKYSMDPDASTEDIPVVAKLRTPPQDRLYNAMLPISKAKYQDLVKLCNTNVIPQRFHSEYKNLPSGATKDTLVDTDIEDENVDD